MNYEERLAKAEEILGKAEKRLEVADVWSVSEAVDMLVGMRPIVGDPDTDPDRIKRDMRELAYGSIDAKTLPCVGKPKQRRVRPADFIRWAMSKGLPIPQRMKALLGVEPFPETAAAPASESEPIKAKPGAPIKIPDEAIDLARQLYASGEARTKKEAGIVAAEKFGLDSIKQGKTLETYIGRQRKKPTQ